jgi:aryl-alcohol dehydrogenase-like predicted oxidoreductase
MSKNDTQLNNESKTNTRPKPPGGIAMLAGHQVGRIGYGAMQLPGPGVWGPPRDQKTALNVLRRAIELGVNHIDTAQFYGDGVSNELIHAALYPYPEDLVLVSKVGAERDDQGHWVPAPEPEKLRAGVEDNLRSLKVDQVDVVNLRVMDVQPDGTPISEDRRSSLLDDQLAEMIDLRDEGKIGGIGISNATLGELRQALSADIVCVQNAYSLLSREDEAQLDLCKEHDIAWVPFFPLGSAGFPGVESVTDHPEVVEAASKLGVTPAQVGLAWLLAHAPNILLIPGTSNPDHLAENIATADVHLNPETMESLNSLVDPSD